MSTLKWDRRGAEAFDTSLLEAAFANQMKAYDSIGEVGKIFDESMRANKELALKEQLQAAQIADYEAKKLGKGYYSKTGSGSGSGGGVAGTDWEAYKANAGLVAPQQGQGTTVPQQAPLERPTAPTAKELPQLLSTEVDAPQLEFLKREQQRLLAEKGSLEEIPYVAPETDALRQGIAAYDQQIKDASKTVSSPVSAFKLWPGHTNIRARINAEKGEATPNEVNLNELTQGKAALESALAKASINPQITSIEKELQNPESDLNWEMQFRQEAANAEKQNIEAKNREIENQRYIIGKENEAARNEFLQLSSAFEKAQQSPTSEQVVGNAVTNIGSGNAPATENGFPDLSKMSLDDLRNYRSKYRQEYLKSLDSVTEIPQQDIEEYRRLAIANLEAQAAAYGRTPTRKEIAAMERSIGPGAAKNFKERQAERYETYEKEIEDWLKIKEGTDKEKSSALLSKVREGNPAEIHKDLTQKITGWESLGDALTPGSGGVNRAEQSVNNLYTLANEKNISLTKMQEGITKSLQALINAEPVSPDWNVELFEETLIQYLQKEKALPEGMSILDLKKALMPESMGLI